MQYLPEKEYNNYREQKVSCLVVCVVCGINNYYYDLPHTASHDVSPDSIDKEVISNIGPTLVPTLSPFPSLCHCRHNHNDYYHLS